MLWLGQRCGQAHGREQRIIGKVKEAWIPSSVFGSDTKSVGGADGGGTVGTFVGGGRYKSVRFPLFFLGIEAQKRVLRPFKLLVNISAL